MKTDELKMVSEWDKTFPKSEKVEHKKITFVNRYGITLAADMYTPKNVEGKLPGNCSERSLRCGKGAVFRIVCTDNGRKRISHNCIRSLLHRRERRYAQIYGIAGY